ncbi:hypothetical protein X975_20748, partial [Stegodyphus mimosarum]
MNNDTTSKFSADATLLIFISNMNIFDFKLNIFYHICHQRCSITHPVCIIGITLFNILDTFKFCFQTFKASELS